MKLTNKDKQYLGSGRFVHDELTRRCASLVETAKKVWREKKGDPSIVILWPSEPLRGAEGDLIEDEVLAELPREDKQERLRRLVDMTKACGLLVIELQPHALVAVFESHNGTRSWTTPLAHHGDVAVLEKTEEHDDVEHYGLLWSPHRGTA